MFCSTGQRNIIIFAAFDTEIAYTAGCIGVIGIQAKTFPETGQKVELTLGCQFNTKYFSISAIDGLTVCIPGCTFEQIIFTGFCYNKIFDVFIETPPETIPMVLKYFSNIRSKFMEVVGVRSGFPMAISLSSLEISL
jgi:hypothetical protein